MENTAVENTRAEHWCTLQNHFAIGGVKTKMSSPSVVRETRGTASTVSNHARTSAVNVLQKIASGNQKCRSTIFDATPHAVHLAVRPVLRFFERKTKQKAKTWKSAFPRGRAKVALCGWPGDQHELHKLGGIRSALRKRAALRKQTQASAWFKVVRTMRGLLRLIMSQKQQTRKSASLMFLSRATCLWPQLSDPMTATWQNAHTTSRDASPLAVQFRGD